MKSTTRHKKRPCQFPEKMFESMFNHALLNDFESKGKKIKLYAPSQNRESVEGIDALFSEPCGGSYRKLIAIQFKIPTYEYKRGKTIGSETIKRGYLKFDLHRNSSGKYHQHEAMLELVRKGLVDEVCYCVPLILSNKKLNEISGASLLNNYSLKIKPATLSSDPRHCCINEKKGRYVRFFCENSTHTEFISHNELFEKDNYFFSDLLDEEREEKLKRFIKNHLEETQDIVFYSF